jgi:hypothetical protein
MIQSKSLMGVLLVLAAGCGGDDEMSGGAHDLTFAGTDYAPHAGMNLKIQVIDTADGAIVKSDMVAVASGMVNFTWPGILEDGHAYNVRWYVDVNGNSICNEPPTDHTWSRDIPAVTDNVTLSHPHDTNLTPVCDTFGTYALTFTGSDFAPHNGHMLKAAILATDNSIVARGSATVAAGTYSINWKALLVTGQTYKVRFYADVNGNGMCDTPPTDHVWEQTIGSVTADKTYDFPHDTNLMDVCSTFAP